MEEVEYHSPYLNKREKEEAKKKLEDYKSQINELLEGLYIDPENPNSLIEMKKDSLNEVFECFKWGSIALMLGPLMSVSQIYTSIIKIKQGRNLIKLSQQTNIFHNILYWHLLPIGLIFINSGICMLYSGIKQSIEYLRLGIKLRKAKKLKNKLENLIKNNIRDLEAKTYLNLLEYHTTSKETFSKVENPSKTKKNKISPIRRSRYLDPKFPLKSKVKSIFFSLKKK